MNTANEMRFNRVVIHFQSQLQCGITYQQWLAAPTPSTSGDKLFKVVNCFVPSLKEKAAAFLGRPYPPGLFPAGKAYFSANVLTFQLTKLISKLVGLTT